MIAINTVAICSAVLRTMSAIHSRSMVTESGVALFGCIYQTQVTVSIARRSIHTLIVTIRHSALNQLAMVF